jgi:hypothetical protein
MAGDGDSDAVLGASAGDGARRAGGADGFGDFGIARGQAGGDLAQRVPHAMLKGGAANVEREIDARAGILDQCDRRVCELVESGIALDQARFGELPFELAAQRPNAVAEQDGADALVGRGDQDGP